MDLCAGGQAWTTKQLWEEFFSDPSLWLDNRTTKKNSRFPDFEHKIIAEKALWIDNRFNPPWVHVRLAIIVQGQKQGQSGSFTPEISGKVLRVEQLWEDFFSDPSQWCDHRFVKKNPKYPDFRHKSTHVGLWIEGWLNPPWVKAKVATMALGQMQSRVGLRTRVTDYSGDGGNVSKLCQEGRLKEALHMVELMVQQASIDNYACLLKGCTRRKALAEGKRLHALIVRRGLDSNIFLQNTLVNMYAKCGSVLDARHVFDSMPEHNVYSWTTIISAYANHGQNEEAINLFQQMQRTHIPPNKVAFVVVLKACARIPALEQGKQFHLDIIKSGLESDMIICNTLVDLYAKCGRIEDARQVFNNMHERNVVSWTAMIAGYAQHGLAKEALVLYKQMKQGGVQPDYVTYVVLLKACARIPALEEGKQLHSDIIASCLEKGTIIGYAQQGLGMGSLALYEQMQREGRLADAEDFISEMLIEPNAVIWMTLLSAARNYDHVEVGRRAFDSVVKLEPENAAAYVLLSNIYAAAGQMDVVAKIKKEMNDVGLKEDPWVQLD